MSTDSGAPQMVSTDELSGRAGTYVLFLELARTCKIVVGRLGAIQFDGGLYAYVGSARGPGGLGARLKRHLSRPKRKRWHIDFLLERARPRGAMVFLSGVREDSLAAVLKSFLPSIRGFGASDDPASESHLFYLGNEPFEAARRLTQLARGTTRCRTAVLGPRNPAQHPPVKRSA